MRHPYLLRVAFIALVYALAAPAFASATSPSNLFPDPFGIYYNTNTAFYPIPSGGLVTLEGLILSSPTGSIPPPAAPGTAIWGGAGASFNAQTFMSFFGGPTLMSFNAGDTAAASITGLLDAPPLHTYATEMLALNLGGLPFGAMIRESPTLASTGGHTIMDPPPAGIYHIDSFFDVFTELSLDGGASWIPSTGPVHIVNPEPASLSLLAVVAAPLLCRRYRRVA